jgi:large subunit ribosomal protein LP2
MKYLAAYLLAALTGEPTEKSVTAIVTAAGGEADAAKVSALFAELSGKSLDEIIAAGACLFSSGSPLCPRLFVCV